MRHGKKLQAQYGFRAPKVVQLDYSNARVNALLPSCRDYPDFETQLRPAPPMPIMTPVWYRAHYEGLFQKLMRLFGDGP